MAFVGERELWEKRGEKRVCVCVCESECMRSRDGQIQRDTKEKGRMSQVHMSMSE